MRMQPKARATAGATCVSSAPCEDHQSRSARARATPKNGVTTPATRMTRPTTRIARGAREAGAARMSTPPNTTRIAAAASRPTGLANSLPMASSVLGERTPIAPSTDTAMPRASATRAMAPSCAPSRAAGRDPSGVAAAVPPPHYDAHVDPHTPSPRNPLPDRPRRRPRASRGADPRHHHERTRHGPPRHAAAPLREAVRGQGQGPRGGLGRGAPHGSRRERGRPPDPRARGRGGARPRQEGPLARDDHGELLPDRRSAGGPGGRREGGDGGGGDAADRRDPRPVCEPRRRLRDPPARAGAPARGGARPEGRLARLRLHGLGDGADAPGRRRETRLRALGHRHLPRLP